MSANPFDKLEQYPQIATVVEDTRQKIEKYAARFVRKEYRIEKPEWFNEVIKNPEWGVSQIHSSVQAFETAVELMQEHVRPALEAFGKGTFSEAAQNRQRIDLRYGESKQLGKISIKHSKELTGGSFDKNTILEEFHAKLGRPSPLQHGDSMDKEVGGYER